MAPDYALDMRACLLKAMKADDGILALIPKASIYPATVPANAAWPFSRIGSIIGTAFAADGLDSAQFRVLVQGFTKDVVSGGVTILPAEDNAYKIGSAFKEALNGKTIPLASGGTATFEWRQNIPLVSDNEASSWYVTAQFDVEVTPT